MMLCPHPPIRPDRYVYLFRFPKTKRHRVHTHTDFMFNSWLATVKDSFCQISFLHQQSVLFHLMHHNLVVTKSTLQHGTLFPLHTEGDADFLYFNHRHRRHRRYTFTKVVGSWRTLAFQA